MKKAIIIEDEINSQKVLKELINSNLPDVEVVGSFESNKEALEYVNSGASFDLAFLDINLLDGLVFNTLDQISEISFDIIFVTAYEEYAIKAFDYSAIGYMLKPIQKEGLVSAYKRLDRSNIEDVTKQIEVLKQVYNNPNSFTKLTISALDGIYFLEMSEIIRMEAEDNYTHIYTTKEPRITVSKTIKKYEELLTNHNFYRNHKSHIVNMNYIKKFLRNERQIVMTDGSKLEIARRRVPGFIERLDNLLKRTN